MAAEWFKSLKWRYTVRSRYALRAVYEMPVIGALVRLIFWTLRRLWLMLSASLRSIGNLMALVWQTFLRVVAAGVSIWLFLQIADVPIQSVKERHFVGQWVSETRFEIGDLVVFDTRRETPTKICAIPGYLIDESRTRHRLYDRASAEGSIIHGLFDIANTTLKASAVFDRRYNLIERKGTLPTHFAPKIDPFCMVDVASRVSNGDCVGLVLHTVEVTQTAPSAHRIHGFSMARSCLITTTQSTRPAPPLPPVPFVAQMAERVGLIRLRTYQ